MEDIERPDSLSGENEELVTTGFSTGDDKNQNYCHRVYNSLKKTSRGVRFIIIVIIVTSNYCVFLPERELGVQINVDEVRPKVLKFAIIHVLSI